MTGIRCYTDGSCSGGRGPMGAGVVIEYGVKDVIEYGGYLGEGTNNIAELTAVGTAMWFLRARIQYETAHEIVVFTDSEYCIGVLTNPAWQPQSNLKLIEDVKALLVPNVVFHHVRGHVGYRGNERADKLAHHARKERMTHEHVFTRNHFVDPRGISHDPLEPLAGPDFSS